MNFEKPHPSVREIDVRALVPPGMSIPSLYDSWKAPFKELIDDWISKGRDSVDGAIIRLQPKAGIDKNAALDHVSRIVNSHLFIHDTKLKSCSYLMDKWFNVHAHEAKVVVEEPMDDWEF